MFVWKVYFITSWMIKVHNRIWTFQLSCEELLMLSFLEDMRSAWITSFRTCCRIMTRKNVAQKDWYCNRWRSDSLQNEIDFEKSENYLTITWGAAMRTMIVASAVKIVKSTRHRRSRTCKIVFFSFLGVFSNSKV